MNPGLVLALAFCGVFLYGVGYGWCYVHISSSSVGQVPEETIGKASMVVARTIYLAACVVWPILVSAIVVGVFNVKRRKRAEQRRWRDAQANPGMLTGNLSLSDFDEGVDPL